MNVIVVANPKGGVGKSTLSTNLAGYFARMGESVMLGDVDRQQSARDWLSLRPSTLPPIRSWDLAPEEPARPPRGTTHVVLDTPAGLHGKMLDRVLKEATHIIVPMQPSMFDILATRHFLDTLRELKAVRKGQLKVGLVGMRVDPRTRSALELERFLSGFALPVLAHLRDTQLYVQLAARGMTLFDLTLSTAQRDLEQWQPLLDWFAPTPRSAAID
jgi:chromosome partitioning protein